MKTKIAVIVMVALVLGTAHLARANLVDSNSIIQDGIEYYIQTDKFVYDLGENVEMLFRVTNLRDTAITIPCTRSGEFNLWVQKDNETIWALAHFFVWYSPGVEFGPGESKELTHTWDMKDDHSKLVTPGIYDVVGVMYTGPPAKVEVPITIVPEPGSLALLGLGLVELLVRSKKRKH